MLYIDRDSSALPGAPSPCHMFVIRDMKCWAYVTSSFFALQCEEVVEERPFRAVRRSAFRTGALALVVLDRFPSQEKQRNKNTRTESLPIPPLLDCYGYIHNAVDSPLRCESDDS